jgi:nucleotide-binding universal stress UspA family protein
MPFLQQAESVMIVGIAEGGNGEEASRHVKDVANYLARHELKAVCERIRPADVTVTNSLLRVIEDENIDLIVAGAYGHSRLGEWAFGGVTHDLIAESPICCMFSH